MQALNHENNAHHLHFSTEMGQHLEEDSFTENLIFSDEAMLHLYGKVNRHNMRTWGTENLHAAFEQMRDSLKLNVLCAISNKKVYEPFFFAMSAVTGTSYFTMMQEWLMLQVDDNSNFFIYQQDGASPHYHHPVAVIQSTFVPVLDQMHNSSRPGAALLATKVT